MNDNMDLGDMEQMRKEIEEFRALLEENKIDDYNPDYHLTKEEVSKILGVSVNSTDDMYKRWANAGIVKKTNIRYPSGRRGVGYILQPGWREKLLKDLSEN
jgi:predicted transcriptional regulator